VAAGLVAAGAAHAEAGDEASAVAPVVVTAQDNHPYAQADAPYHTLRSASGKLTEPLLDVAKSISILSSEVIKDSGANSFRDLMRTQPGVTLGTGEGGNAFGDRVFIRGFDARNDVYIDAVRDPGVGSRELFAVEQVEVMKGPSSTFSGRGATGGSVNLVSKAPGPKDAADLELTLGDDKTRRTTLDVNHRLSPDLTVRLNAVSQSADVAGRDHVHGNLSGIAAAAAWTPAPDLKLTSDFYHLQTDDTPDWGVPYDVAHNRPFAVKRGAYYGILKRDFRRTWSDIGTLKGQWTLNDSLTLSSLVRYGQSANAYTASAPERPDPVARTVLANAKRRDAVTDYLVSQSDLTARFATFGLAHTLVAGVELSRESVLNRARASTECAVLPCTGTSTSPVLNLDNPDNAMPWAVGSNSILTRTRVSVDTSAAYLLDTVELRPGLKLFGGLRYDNYNISLWQKTVATGVVVDRQQDQGFWNGQGSLIWKPRANGSLYLSFSTSSNPSGEQLDSVGLDYGGFDPRTVNLAPEHNESFEAGTKWDLADGKLNLTAALFRIDKTNARVNTGGGSSGTVILAGLLRADGLELTASGNPAPGWSVFGGATWLDARTVKSPVASQVGLKFANTPDFSANLTVRRQLGERGHAGATWTYTGRRYGGTATANTTFICGYNRLDLFAGWDLSRHASLSVNLLNATNKLYYDALYRSATPFTYVAPGRSLQLKLDLEF
jgi:catecholate siderophore receptor